MAKFTLVMLDGKSNTVTESVDDLECVALAFEHVEKISNLIHALDVLTENGYRVIVEHGGSTWIHGHTQGGALMEGPWDAVKSAVGSARDVLNRGANKNVNWDNIKKGVGQFYQGAKDRYKEATRDPFEDLTISPEGRQKLQAERDAYDQKMRDAGYRQEDVPQRTRTVRSPGATATRLGQMPGASSRERVTTGGGKQWVKENLPANAQQPIEGEVMTQEQLDQYKSQRDAARQPQYDDFEDFEIVDDVTTPAAPQAPRLNGGAPASLPPSQAKGLPPGSTKRTEMEQKAGGQTLKSGEPIQISPKDVSGRAKALIGQLRKYTPEQRQAMRDALDALDREAAQQ